MKKITLLAATLFAAVSFGQELITNGTFDSDASGWGGVANKAWLHAPAGTIADTTLDDASGIAAVENIGKNANDDLTQTISGLTEGSNYTLSFDYELTADGDGNAAARYTIDGNVNNLNTVQSSSATFAFNASATSIDLAFRKTSEGADGFYIDNVSLKLTSTLSLSKFNADGTPAELVATYNLLGQQVNFATAPNGIYVNIYSNGYTEKVSK